MSRKTQSGRSLLPVRSSVTPIATPRRIKKSSDASTSSSGLGFASGSALKSISKFRLSNDCGRLSSASGRFSFVPDGKKERMPTDKTSHQRNLNILFEFLHDHNYGHPLTAKLRAAPTTKEVTSMFQFIMSRHLIYYKMSDSARLEEELPRILQMLGFRYSVTKGQLLPIGTNRSWTIMASAFSWICVLIKYKEHLSENPINLFPIDTEESEYPFYYLQKVNIAAYEAYMKGSDDDEIDDLDSKFIVDIKSKAGSDFEHIEQQEIKFGKKTQILKEMKEMYLNNQKMCKVFEADIEKMIAYSDDMKTFREILENQLAIAANDLTVKLNEIDTLNNQIIELKGVVADQEMTVDEVVQVSLKLNALKQCLMEAETEREQLKKKYADIAEQETKAKQELQNEIASYEEIARSCKLIPETAQNSQGHCYSIRIQKPEREDSLANVIDVVGRLTVINKQCKEDARDSKLCYRKALDATEHLEKMLLSKNEVFSDGEANLKLIDEDIASLKLNHEDEIEQLKEEHDCITRKIENLRKSGYTTSDVLALKKSIAEKEERYKEEQLLYTAREETLNEFLLKITEMAADYKLNVDQCFKEIQIRAGECRRKRELDFNYKEVEDKKNKVMSLKEEFDKLLLHSNFSL